MYFRYTEIKKFFYPVFISSGQCDARKRKMDKAFLAYEISIMVKF
jgi:hypothetical protein